MDWRAWVSGGVAGVSLSIMGHPFDTIKTRMQTNPSHRSAFACATTLARQEGMLSLWKGISPAIAAGVMTGSIRFGVQSWANRTLAWKMGARDFADLNLGTRVVSESLVGLLPAWSFPFCLHRSRWSNVGNKSTSWPTQNHWAHCTSCVVSFARKVCGACTWGTL